MFNIQLFVWTFLSIGFVFILTLLHSFIRTRRLVNKIPGPPTSFIIGNLMDIWLNSEQIWKRFRRFSKEYYPIYRVWAIHVPAVSILDPQDIEILLSTSKHTEKSVIYNLLTPWLGTGLLTSAGEKWQTRRKILTPTFHFNILQQFVNVFKEQSELLVQRLEEECGKSHTNVVPIITEYTLRTISETAMGFRLDLLKENQQNYVASIYRIGQLIVHRLLRPWIYKDWIYFFTSQRRTLMKQVRVLHDFSNSVIQERKKNFNSDDIVNAGDEDVGSKKRLAMLDLLISTQKLHGTIDDEGIREEVDTFMFEGHDTTSMAISFALFLLANHPHVQEKVVMELDEIFGGSDRRATYQDLQSMAYLEMVLKESMRLYPSVPFISRACEEDFKTRSGYTVPKGLIVHVHIYDLHRNPEIYPEPDKFDPERFLPENTQNRHAFAYLPFSAGPRNCIGQRFAMLELKSAISAILRRFVLEAVDTPKDLVIIADLVIRTRDGIKIKFTRRRK